jgi:hypothetical protein
MKNITISVFAKESTIIDLPVPVANIFFCQICQFLLFTNFYVQFAEEVKYSHYFSEMNDISM